MGGGGHLVRWVRAPADHRPSSDTTKVFIGHLASDVI